MLCETCGRENRDRCVIILDAHKLHTSSNMQWNWERHTSFKGLKLCIKV